MEYITSHPICRYEDTILSDLRDGKEYSNIAKNCGCGTHHVLKLARQKGLLSGELTKYDFEFISNYNSTLARGVIAHCLGLNKQTIWKVQKRHNLKSNAQTKIVSMQDATRIFKFLLEEDYQLPKQFHLPNLRKAILNGPYYELYEFGLKYIEEHDISSVMGMLAENAYPDQYRIFQFRSKNGSKNFQKIEDLNEALLWCFEKMTTFDLISLAHKDESVALMNLNEPIIGFNADKLRTKYISRKDWNTFYPDFKALKKGLASYVGIRSEVTRRRMSTNALRKTFNLANNCEFCRYDKNPEIHHIYPVEDTRNLIPDEEINLEQNLIVLCPNHHRIASRFDWRSSFSSSPEKRKKHLLDFLKN
jgi:hypothetical protein